jgi:hypothetical protein
MRKRITALIAVILLLCTTGCSGEQKNIKNTVKAYLDATRSGDVTEAITYLDVSDDFLILHMEENIKNALKSADLSDDFDERADAFITKLFSKTVQSYEIKDIHINGKSAAVTVDIYGISPISVAGPVSVASSDITANATNYMNEHSEELNQIRMEQGQDAALKKILEEAAQTYFKDLDRIIDGAVSENKIYVISLIKSGEEWKIISIEEDES